MMMSAAEKDAAICEETLITLDGGDASHTDTECAREAIAVEIEQKTDEELASRLATFFSNEELCEDTVMLDKQNGSAGEKEELCAANKNKSEEDHNPSAASSKKVMSTTDEVAEEEIEVDRSSSKEMYAEEEEIKADKANVAPPKNEMNTAEEAVEENAETQNLSTASSKKEMSMTDGAVEEGREADKANVAPSKNEMNTAEEAVEENAETQNLSSAPSKKEVSMTDGAVEEGREADKANVAPPKNKMNTAEEAVEENAETQNLSTAPSKKEVSMKDEAVEERTEAQPLSAVGTTEDVIEKTPEFQNLRSTPSEEVSITEKDVEKNTEAQNLRVTTFSNEESTTEEAVEGPRETQNLSAIPSNEEESTTEEAVERRSETQNLSATEEALEIPMETPNFSAPPLKEVSTTGETREKKTEDQNVSVALSNKEATTTKKTVKKKTKAQKLVSLPSMKGKILKAAIEKRTECQNLRLGLTNRKISTPEETEEEEKANNAGVSPCNKVMSTVDEENDPNICEPSKKVCTAVKAVEKNREEPKASTSASCSRSDPDVSVLRNIPRNSNLVRGRLSLHSRRALMNRQARRSQGIHFAFNGKTIAPKRPRVSVPRVHVTAEAFPSLASELYSLLPETFKDAVSLSMMEYYMMILYYHRLAGLRMNRRAPLPQDEVLCSNLELAPLYVPEIFEQWITMRGHDVNTRGETIRLILPPLPSDTGDFGCVSATTHWRYISDLAPRVFRDRIVADLQHTLSSGPVEWDLHEDIRPQEKNCGLPTRNLIGYHVAQTLTPSQIDELHLCGIGLWNDKAVFPVDVDAECYHLNIHLVRTISQHFATLGLQFRIVRHAQYDSQPSSAGLIVYGERMISETEEYIFDRNIGHYEHTAKVRAYAPVAMDKELAKGAVVFLPRVYRRDGKRPVMRSWCAYDFGFYFMVPDEWTATRNNAYKQGTWQTWHTPHLTTASVTRADLLKAVVKRSVLSQEQPS